MGAEWFGERLKELREAAGLTQAELAERAGLSQRAVSHWEQKLREPSWSAVVALSGVLDVDCTAFLSPPAQRHEQRRGRPRKTEAESQPKKPGRKK